MSTDAILNQSEPNVILTAHATKVNRTANVFGLSKSRLKTDKTVYINNVSLPNYSLVCNASTSRLFLY